MENAGPGKGHTRQVKSKKLKSPKNLRGNTMDSFQDGGQQNMSNEQGEYFNQIEGPNMNVDMNNYPPSSREQMMGVDNYGRMNPMMHPGQMQGYNPYNRENFNPGDQHGGMAGSSEIINQNTFQAQYMQPGMKSGHPGKPNMMPMRPQMGPGGPGMPQSYPQGQRSMLSGQSISQQSGPTPTLNQLLQTPNTPGRMQGNNYGEYHQKVAPEMTAQGTPYNMQQGWTGNRQPASFPQGPGTPYRGQGGPDAVQQRSSFSPNYSMMPNQYSPGQFSPNSRFGMAGTPNRQNAGYNNQMGPQYGHQQPSSDQHGFGSTPSQQYLPPSSQSYMPHNPSRQHTPSGPTPPPSSRISPAPSDSSNSQPPALSPTPSRQQTSQTPPSSGLQQPISQQPSPAGSNSSWSGTNNSNTSKRNGEDIEMSGDLQSEESIDGVQHPAVSALRPIPSPVGSSGSRSNTPASLPGNAVGSPMQPRSSSQQIDGQNTHMNQSPMATQGYSQQMMPPPMGPNHMNYGPGGKMPPNNMSGPAGNYQPYNSQYQPQPGFPNRQGMGMSPNSGMQNYPQNVYNGPSQPPMSSSSNMYSGQNMQMNRNMNNSNFMYGQQAQGNAMNSQYGNINHINSTGPQGPQAPPVAPPSSAINSASGVQSPGMQSATTPVKGAHAAAQAALAAAAAASGRPQPIRSNMTSPQRMFSPQNVNHNAYGPQVNNSIPNSTSPLPKSQSPVPSSTFGPPHNSMANNGEDSNLSDSSRVSQPTNSSHIPTLSESMPSSHNASSDKPSMQQDSNSCSSTLSNTSIPGPGDHMSNSAINSGILPDSNSDTNMSEPTLENGPRSSTPDQSSQASSSSELKKPMSELAGLIADDSDSHRNRMVSSRPSEQRGFPPSPKNEMPITTTATTNNTGQPMMEGQHNHIPPHNSAPIPHLMSQIEAQQSQPSTPAAEKKKKEVITSSAPSPGGASNTSSYLDDIDNINSPTTWTSSKGGYGDIQKMYEMGNEPDRRFFLDRLFMFLDDKNTPLTSTPSISKQPLDLYKLYFHVRERGGMQEVTKTKKWKEICGVISIGSSASAAFTLKKNYIKYLFAYECQFDRGGMDPQPVLAQIEAQLQQKREQKNRGRAPSPANSQGSQDAFRPPSTPNNNQGMDGYPHGMNPNYMNDPQMGPMGGGMMPPNNMMNNMMPNAMGMNAGMPHGHGPMHAMQGNMMPGNMPQGGVMGNKAYSMMQNQSHGPGMMGNSMMPGNGMMPQQGMGMQGNPNMMQSMQNAMSSGGMPNNPMSSAGMPNNPMVPGGMPNNPMATGGMPNNPMATGGIPNNPMASGGMPNNPMAAGGMPNNPNMMSSGSITNPNMMSGGAIMPQGSMGTNPNMMSGPMTSNPMMSGGPNTPAMISKPGKNDSVSCQDPFADEPSFSRQQRGSNSPMPNFSGMPPQAPPAAGIPPQSGMPPSSSSSSFNSYNRPSMPPQQNFPIGSQPNASDTPTPPTSQSIDTFGTEPIKSSSDTTAASSSPPIESMISSTTTFTSSHSNTMPQLSTSGKQFPFGDQFSQPERFESTSSPLMTSCSSQQMPPIQQPPMPSQNSVSQHMEYSQSQTFSTMQSKPAMSQSMDPMMSQRYIGQQSQSTPTSQNMETMYSHPRGGNQQVPPTQSSTHPMEPMYSNRYGNQHYQQGAPYSEQHPPTAPQQPGFGTGYVQKPMMGQDYQNFPNQQGAYSGPRPQMSQDMPGSVPQMYNTPNKRYPNTYDQEQGKGHPQWSSPMGPRYPAQHPNYGPGGGGMHMASPYQRVANMRMSPQRGDKHMSPQRMQKSVSMGQNSAYPPKKEMMFPPDSIESISPVLTKRKRLTKTDVGQIEAWRIMMALKSGLLAESTWAIDTLNILLFDDSTISYFNLSHLPGLLEVLLEHFRRCLIEMFGEIFEESERGMCDQYNESFDSINFEKDVNVLNENGAKVKVEGVFTDYTNVTRKGKTVKFEETNELGPTDQKRWDVYSGYSCKFGHWQLGGGDTSIHIVPLFSNKNENEISKKMFLRKPMKLKEEFSDDKENCDENENNLVDSKDNIKVEISEESNNCLCEKSDLKIEHNCDIQYNKVLVKKEPNDEECEENSGIKDEVDEGRSNGCDGHSDTSEKENVEHLKEEKMEESQSEEKIKEEQSQDLEEKDNTSLLENLNNGPQSNSKRKIIELEDESYQKDEHPLNTACNSKDEIGRKCVCLSNIFRSLSCVNGNTTEISKNAALMFTLGKLLTLHHHHLPRNTTRRKFDREDTELEDLSDSHLLQSEEEWWWQYLSLIRENVLVIFANIASHLELAIYPEEICLPILDGLVHWAVCPSACATDPFPSSTSSVLSPQRLVFEALSKLCIHESNVDLLLATPPFSRIISLVGQLVKALANKSEPVMMEFSIVLLAELVQGDTSAARAVAMKHPSVSLLLDFLEMAEHKAMQVANMHGINMLRDNPEMMGTSLDMLRRAATILLHMAMVPDNRQVFSHHQQRLLSLVMSQILDQYVAQILSDVLFHCFREDDLILS
ncbi:trithorax group protein osa-like isoform X6 [Mytilus edulis]|uniref:trithorax group protein osa-like isoform X6 n=1 Tax=Mytilus edulis TaxID=6550 RepID=UPI0039EE7741